MAAEKEYLRKLSTEQLEGLIAREVYGMDILMLSSIYRICMILAERDPTRGSTRDIFLEFAGSYADHRFLWEE